MKLRQRYSRLAVWNKIALWGSIASLIGLAVAVAQLTLSPSIARLETRLDALQPAAAAVHANAVRRISEGGGIVGRSRWVRGSAVKFIEPVADWGAALPHLRDVQDLRELDLSALYKRMSDLTHVSELSQLQVLVVSGTAVTDLGPVASLFNLRVLDISGCAVSDISPLAANAELRILFMGETRVADLTPLHALSKLRKLDLTYIDIGPPGPRPTPVGEGQLRLLREWNPGLEIVQNDKAG